MPIAFDPSLANHVGLCPEVSWSLAKCHDSLRIEVT
jgi:hypothetical protein